MSESAANRALVKIFLIPDAFKHRFDREATHVCQHLLVFLLEDTQVTFHDTNAGPLVLLEGWVRPYALACSACFTAGKAGAVIIPLLARPTIVGKRTSLDPRWAGRRMVWREILTYTQPTADNPPLLSGRKRKAKPQRRGAA